MDISNRTKRFYFRATDEEAEFIKGKFQKSGMKNLSDYLRKMSMLGFILHFDENEIKKMQLTMSNIASNINQITRRANSTGNIYAEDINEIKEVLDKLWQSQAYIQSMLHKLNP